MNPKEVVAGQPLIEFVKLCVESDCSPYLIGRPGAGKSEILEQAADEMGMAFIARDLSLMEPPDLLGMPRPAGNSTVYLQPSWLPTKGRGLLVFEELNRCASYVRVPCLQLLTSKTLNDYKLPAGWAMATAVNPADDDTDVVELGLAFTSRFVKATVVPDKHEWLLWAEKNGVHAKVRNFVGKLSTPFNHKESSPRSWHMVSKLLHAFDNGRFSHNNLRTAIDGTLNCDDARAFWKFFIGDERPLSADEILQAYVDDHRSRLKQWRDARKRIDLVEESLRNVLLYLQNTNHYKNERKNRNHMKNLAMFCNDLPGDLRERAERDFRQRKRPFPPDSTARRRTKKARRGA